MNCLDADLIMSRMASKVVYCYTRDETSILHKRVAQFRRLSTQVVPPNSTLVSGQIHTRTRYVGGHDVVSCWRRMALGCAPRCVFALANETLGIIFILLRSNDLDLGLGLSSKSSFERSSLSYKAVASHMGIL